MQVSHLLGGCCLDLSSCTAAQRPTQAEHPYVQAYRMTQFIGVWKASSKTAPSEILPTESGHCKKQITQIKLPQPAVLSVATASSDKADSTWRCSQAVPHPSTNQALGSLTSEVRRDPVYSTRYGRQRDCFDARPQRLHAMGQGASQLPLADLHLPTQGAFYEKADST